MSVVYRPSNACLICGVDETVIESRTIATRGGSESPAIATGVRSEFPHPEHDDDRAQRPAQPPHWPPAYGVRTSPAPSRAEEGRDCRMTSSTEPVPRAAPSRTRTYRSYVHGAVHQGGAPGDRF